MLEIIDEEYCKEPIIDKKYKKGHRKSKCYNCDKQTRCRLLDKGCILR